jgi:hypothetical protein
MAGTTCICRVDEKQTKAVPPLINPKRAKIQKYVHRPATKSICRLNASAAFIRIFCPTKRYQIEDEQCMLRWIDRHDSAQSALIKDIQTHSSIHSFIHLTFRTANLCPFIRVSEPRFINYTSWPLTRWLPIVMNASILLMSPHAVCHLPRCHSFVPAQIADHQLILFASIHIKIYIVELR